MAEPILAEQIAKQLRKDILRGKLLPGASIKERDNAAEMGVSRTPMREAIRILAKEGLVELRPSRSPIVAQPLIKDVTDQAIVLIALEKLSAELACQHITDPEIDRIAAIIGEMADAYDTVDPIDFFEIDMSFHKAIAEASDNKALAATHNSLLQRLWRARYLGASQRRDKDRLVHDHTKIIDALRARDPIAANAAIDAHLGNLPGDIRKVLETEPVYSSKEESENPT